MSENFSIIWFSRYKAELVPSRRGKGGGPMVVYCGSAQAPAQAPRCGHLQLRGEQQPVGWIGRLPGVSERMAALHAHKGSGCKPTRLDGRPDGHRIGAPPPTHLTAEHAEGLRAPVSELRVGGVFAPHGGAEDSAILCGRAGVGLARSRKRRDEGRVTAKRSTQWPSGASP